MAHHIGNNLHESDVEKILDLDMIALFRWLWFYNDMNKQMSEAALGKPKKNYVTDPGAIESILEARYGKK